MVQPLVDQRERPPLSVPERYERLAAGIGTGIVGLTISVFGISEAIQHTLSIGEAAGHIVIDGGLLGVSVKLIRDALRS